MHNAISKLSMLYHHWNICQSASFVFISGAIARFGVHACKLIPFPEAGKICLCIYRNIHVLCN